MTKRGIQGLNDEFLAFPLNNTIMSVVNVVLLHIVHGWEVE